MTGPFRVVHDRRARNWWNGLLPGSNGREGWPFKGPGVHLRPVEENIQRSVVCSKALASENPDTAVLFVERKGGPSDDAAGTTIRDLLVCPNFSEITPVRFSAFRLPDISRNVVRPRRRNRLVA
jgi:hypothetical protein